jgi:hypothetical protein
MNDGSHSQNVQHGQPTQKPLSCTNCRQRKVKCDRMTPCLHCRMSERQCIYPSRVRVRRSHQAVESCNKELYDRIRHLEKLVSEIGASASSGINCDHGSMEAVAESPIQTPAPVPAEDYFITQRDHLDDQGLAIVRQQETGSRVLGHTFWMSLSQEVGGLRKLLDETADSEDVPYSDASDTADTKSSPILLFNDLPILFQPEDPPKFQCSILARHYFSNIHPICKILHGPTIAAYLEVGTQSFNDGEAPSQSNGVKAITFAIYFAAVTSMSAVDCEKYLRAEKGAMIRWYKQNAEAALARAELLHSVDIATLQAFVLYIVSAPLLCVDRSGNRPRSLTMAATIYLQSLI